MAKIDCTDNNLSPELYLRSTLGEDSNGNCAVRLIEVVDGNAPVETCDLNHLTAFEFLKKILDVDGNGKLAIRVIQGTDSGNQCIDCDNNHKTLEDLLLHSLIGLADDGRPALRLIS